MAIQRFTSSNIDSVINQETGKPWADGAFCMVLYPNSKDSMPVVRWDEFVGMCLSKDEINGYDDSDFVMTIWDAEKCQPFTLTYASTRFWTYPSWDSKADATPEVRALYEAWLENEKAKALKVWRQSKADELRKHRAMQVEAAMTHGFPVMRLRKLMKLERSDRAVPLLKLLCSKRLRSEFKLSLQRQIAKWLSNTSPEYKSPLSASQWYYVAHQFVR